jgi:hypothetical protein
MNKEFVPYEPSLALKELGFDEPCILLYRGLDTQPVCQMGYGFKTEKNSDYNDETNYWLTVPTYSQAFRFFREKYGLYHSIGLDNSLENNINCDYQIINHSQSISELETSFKSYEEAELACLIKLIEIVKNK